MIRMKLSLEEPAQNDCVVAASQYFLLACYRSVPLIPSGVVMHKETNCRSIS